MMNREDELVGIVQTKFSFFHGVPIVGNLE